MINKTLSEFIKEIPQRALIDVIDKQPTFGSNWGNGEIVVDGELMTDCGLVARGSKIFKVPYPIYFKTVHFLNDDLREIDTLKRLTDRELYGQVFFTLFEQRGEEQKYRKNGLNELDILKKVGLPLEDISSRPYLGSTYPDRRVVANFVDRNTIFSYHFMPLEDSTYEKGFRLHSGHCIGVKGEEITNWAEFEAPFMLKLISSFAKCGTIIESSPFETLSFGGVRVTLDFKNFRDYGIKYVWQGKRSKT